MFSKTRLLSQWYGSYRQVTLMAKDDQISWLQFMERLSIFVPFVPLHCTKAQGILTDFAINSIKQILENSEHLGN